MPESVLQCPWIRGHDALHQRDARAIRAGAGPSTFSGSRMTERKRLRQDDATTRLQFVANKRWAQGRDDERQLHLGAALDRRRRNTRTGIGNAFVDDVSLLKNNGPYFSQRKHRVTASGVWELPWTRIARTVIGYVLGGWSIAPMFVFQSGQPWDMPGNVDLAPGVDLKDIALNGKKEGQFIYGVKPCVGQLQRRRPASTTCSRTPSPTAARSRTSSSARRSSAAPRCSATTSSAGRSTGKSTRTSPRPIADHRQDAVPAAHRGVQPPQQPDVRRACSTTQDTTSADFGRINRNVTGQSNFQRFIQLGFRLLF